MSAVKTIQRALASRERQQEKLSIPRPPSPRDMEIFNRVVANCEPQKIIAAELHLHPSRISQILRRVRLWQSRPRTPCGPASPANSNSPAPSDQPNNSPPEAGVSPALPTRRASEAPSSLAPDDQHRLSLAILISRHENIYTLYMREYHRQEATPQLTITRTESKTYATPSGDNSPASDPQPPSPVPRPPSSYTKQTTTLRDQPPSIQLLKAAHRTLVELRHLHELDSASDTLTRRASEECPSSTPETPPDDASIQSTIHSLLAGLRDKAEDAGRVPKSTNSYQLLKNLLAAFLGHDRGDGGGFLSLDDAIRHFLKTFLISPANVIPRDPEPEQLLSDLISGAGILPAEQSPPSPATFPAPTLPLTPSPAQFPSPPLTFPQLERAKTSSPDTASLSTDLPLTPTPNPTSTTPPEPASTPKPAPTPRKKSSTPTPQPSTSNPQNLPFLSPITDAQYAALFHPWAREY